MNHSILSLFFLLLALATVNAVPAQNPNPVKVSVAYCYNVNDALTQYNVLCGTHSGIHDHNGIYPRMVDAVKADYVPGPVPNKNGVKGTCTGKHRAVAMCCSGYFPSQATGTMCFDAAMSTEYH